MGAGFLQVAVTTAKSQTIPIPRAVVTITQGTNTLNRFTTDENGRTGKAEIPAPDKALTLDPAYKGEPYARCDVTVTAPGYKRKVLRGVKILDTITSVLKVELTPESARDADRGRVPGGRQNTEELTLGEHQLVTGAPRRAQEYSDFTGVNPRILPQVIIPTYITVHLGTPTSDAQNVTVTFRDYIKNVCTNEIYATWPEAAIRANIYCQISLALNRVYTEWYRARGYPYDITNSTAYDQYFVYGSDTAENINEIVDEIFNQYARREGHKEPFYTEYCDGIKAQCPGLKQWGTVTLAEEGYSPIEMLRYYYPDDIQITESTNFQDIEGSYPGYVLRVGSSGSHVKAIQNYLNRIRLNYPNIPQIENPDGYFGEDTAAAVKEFQRIQELGPLAVDGQVGKKTWYKISYAYSAVKKLAELGSEGEVVGVGRTPPTVTISEGSRGTEVGRLQYLLSFIADFYPEVPYVVQDYNFSRATDAAVKAFQKAFGLTQDGIVGPGTWQQLYNEYWQIKDTVNIPGGGLPAYPGYALSFGASGTPVRQIQQCLNNIAARYPAVGRLTADGVFGSATRNAVAALQRVFGLTPDGIVGTATWNLIMQECAVSGGNGGGSYPGYALRNGSSGEAVLQIQKCLNAVSNSYPSISRITADGKFGNGTESAVIAFQRIFGLTADGVVGQATWHQLLSECQFSGGINTPYPGYLISVGASGDYVLQIQRCLNRIANDYPSIPWLTEDGKFGSGTKNAVMVFQRIFGLTADGIVGQATWNQIKQQCGAVRNRPRQSAAPEKPPGGVRRNPQVGGFAGAQPPAINRSDMMTMMLFGRLMNRNKPWYY